MTKEKACKVCNKIYEGGECPNCGSKEFTNTIKGRLIVVNPEKSEIAKNLKINGKGVFAIKTK